MDTPAKIAAAIDDIQAQLARSGGTTVQLFQKNLTYIPYPLPPTLKNLYCHKTRITTLPPLPPTLEALTCGGARITSLPPLPPTLRFLHCGKTLVTELPSLPPALEIICFHNTQITSLPPLPPTLKTLDCSNTQITSLPPLPPTLKNLCCSSTRITELPLLPPRLSVLTCGDTRITSLPPLQHISLCQYIIFNKHLLIKPPENLGWGDRYSLYGNDLIEYDNKWFELYTRLGRALRAELAARQLEKI